MSMQRLPFTRRAAALARLTITSIGALGLTHAALAQAPVSQSLPSTAAPARASFRLADVRLKGVAAMDEKQLHRLVAPYLGREVTLNELKALAQEITNHYRERGYFLAQAIIPVQQVKDGVVEISVIEGRLGRVDIQVAPDAPITAERVRAFLAAVPVGEAINAADYERAMLLLSDQPGIKVTSGLQQGAASGTVDLAVEVVAARRWSFTAEADNHGTLETGRWRIGGTVRWNSPAGVGDNLDARLMVSDRGLTFGRLGYELPLGGSGLRLGLGAARVQYEVGGAFEPLDARGQADVLDASLNYPFIRQRNHNLMARLVLESKRLKDDYRAVDVSLGKRVNDVGLGWAWDRRDNWWGGGYFASTGTLYSGHLRIQDAGAAAADQAPGGLNTSGGYSRLVFQFSRLQSIAPRHTLYYSIGGQWASKNLDASEKLALGGARAVRAYAASEALVDQGWIQTIEWRWSATDELTPYLFFDAAHGRQAKRPVVDIDNAISLRGAGIGLAWGKPGDFSLNATLAWRTGTRRGLADGGGRNPRFFIQAQKAF